MSERRIVAYLDGVPVFEEDPNFAKWMFLPDDDELDAILGPGGAEDWREMERQLGYEAHPFLIRHPDRLRIFIPAPLI
jgi:hypothetical protein